MPPRELPWWDILPNSNNSRITHLTVRAERLGPDRSGRIYGTNLLQEKSDDTNWAGTAITCSDATQRSFNGFNIKSSRCRMTPVMRQR